MIGKANMAMVQAHGDVRVLPFRRLPRTAQLAYFHYWTEGLSAEDAALSDDALLAELRASDLKLGYGTVPMKVLKREIMQRGSDELADFADFDEYHRWNVSTLGHVPRYSRKSAWPCFLSQMEDEVFEDGWHRFHRYVQLKLRNVPVVFVPKQ